MPPASHPNPRIAGSSSGCGCLLLLAVAIGILVVWHRYSPSGDSADQRGFQEQYDEGGTDRNEPPQGSGTPVRALVSSCASPQPASPDAQPAEEWQRAPNWTRAKAKHIDDLTEEDREAIYNWADDKESLREMLASCQDTFREISSQPAYQYDSAKLSESRRLAEAIQRCIDNNDPLRIVYQLRSPFESSFRAFTASVVWRQGVRHPTAPHVHSGNAKDSWEPDDGYVFASSASGDLSVVYRGHAYRCSRCKGSGSVVQEITCPRCQGKGRIPNPLVQGANLVSGFAELADSFSSHSRRSHSSQQINDPGLVCPQCRGNRTLRQTVECPDCENGTVWR